MPFTGEMALNFPYTRATTGFNGITAKAWIQ